MRNQSITRLSALWPAAVLVCGTLLVYYAVFGYGFLPIDDYTHISNNPLIIQPTFENLAQFWTGTYFDLYIPVAYTTWWTLSWLSQAIWGELNPALFHGVNVAVHLINTILVYALTRLLGRNSKREILRNPVTAVTVAAFFAWHPMQVEAVAWIASLRDLLAFCFSTLYLILVLRTWSQDKRRAHCLILAHGFLVLALLSKPVTVISPLVLMALGWGFGRQSFRETLRAALPGLCFGVPVIVTTMFAQEHATELIYNPPWGRPIVASDTVAFYVAKLLMPIGLAADYFRTPAVVLEDPVNRAKLLLSAAFVFWVIKYRATRTELVALALAALMPVLPVSGLATFAFQKFSTVSDRYFYASIPYLGMLLVIALSLIPRKAVQAAVICIGLSALLFISHHQVAFWENGVVLSKRILEVSPRSFMGNITLGSHYIDNDEPQKAIDHLKTALQIDDRSPVLVSFTAEQLIKLERYTEARDFLGEYVDNLGHFTSQPPAFIAKLYVNYGIALIHLDQHEPAKTYFIRARSLEPDNPVANEYLGNL